MSAETKGRLAGQSALITGASRGIGLAIARAFAREGADLTIAATNAERLAVAAAELAQAGGRVEVAVADVGDMSALPGLVDQTVAAYGRIDILVNNAGIYIGKSFLDYDERDVDDTLAVNVKAPMFLMQAALRHMVQQQYGRIINIASTAGKWASRNQAVYNISKHAVVGLTRCAALEFAQQGITINALCPGMIQTDMAAGLEKMHAQAGGVTPETVHGALLQRIAQGRFLDPAECGELAVYLASPEARGMTGQSVLLDGGMLYV
ncbi:MAG: SDR family oxidoreductase [Burkholderiaceae bacterium]